MLLEEGMCYVYLACTCRPLHVLEIQNICHNCENRNGAIVFYSSGSNWLGNENNLGQFPFRKDWRHQTWNEKVKQTVRDYRSNGCEHPCTDVVPADWFLDVQLSCLCNLLYTDEVKIGRGRIPWYPRRWQCTLTASNTSGEVVTETLGNITAMPFSQ